MSQNPCILVTQNNYKREGDIYIYWYSYHQIWYFDVFRYVSITPQITCRTKSLNQTGGQIGTDRQLQLGGNLQPVQWPGFSGLLGLPENLRENQEEAMLHGYFPQG